MLLFFYYYVGLVRLGHRWNFDSKRRFFKDFIKNVIILKHSKIKGRGRGLRDYSTILFLKVKKIQKKYIIFYQEGATKKAVGLI